MNKKIFELANQAGATTSVSDEEVNETTDVWFSREEFENFITALVKYQVSVMRQIESDRGADFMGDDVPPTVIIFGMEKDILNDTV